jgi:GR25 family glycosyltransferase involved in LPS biosynthesis
LQTNHGADHPPMPEPQYIGRYINLDRSPERRRLIEAEIASIGGSAPYERFAAVEGQTLASHPEVDDRGSLGCYLSHLEAIKLGAPSGAWLHVLEDDAVVSRFFGGAMAAITQDPQFEQFDVIFTNVMTLMRPRETPIWRALFDRNVSVDAEGFVTAVNVLTASPLRNIEFGLTTSYLVNPRSIERVADMLGRQLKRSPFIPVDYAFDYLSRSGDLTAACTMPFLTAPRLTEESTIRPGMGHLRAAHLYLEWALFADRDPIDLARRLDEAIQAKAPSVTRDLIAGAYRYLLSDL